MNQPARLKSFRSPIGQNTRICVTSLFLSLPLYADVLLGHREVFMRFFREPCREATKAAMVCVYPFLTKDWHVVKFL